MTCDREHPHTTTGTGRLLTVLSWAVLLFGLWLWGREITGLPDRTGGPA